jgi:predicted NBD/HSP70 family sugar kinase
MTAESLRLTKSTVSSLVRELMCEGWLLERGVVATGELGRRPTPLYINPGRLVLLGAELGVETIRVVATSLMGDILATATGELDAGCQAELGVELTVQLLLEVSSRLDARYQHVVGIGVGLPGGVDEFSGHLHFAPNLGWRNIPVGALLARHLQDTALQGLPLYLQNDADVAALGELEFAAAEKSGPLIYLNLSHGVGAGVIVDDCLLTGSHGFAGEVGHTILQLNGPLCSCGRRGCAEAMIGLRAMLPPPPKTEQALQGVPVALRDIQRQLHHKTRSTEDAVARAGSYLGMLLWNLNAAYDPAHIVLGGPAVELGGQFLDPALHTLRQYSSSSGMAQPHVAVSRFGANAVAVGAAALVRYRLTRPLLARSVLAAASA